MSKKNQSIVTTYYYFSLGMSNRERPTIIPIKEQNLGKALERVRPELLNHIYSLTVHRYSHSSTRADNMYIGQVHDAALLRNDNPRQYDLIYEQALQRANGEERLLTDKYCQCANGGMVLLKDNEKVYDRIWQCIWPHHEQGSLLYKSSSSVQEDASFQIFGIPERLYEFVISQSDNTTKKKECFFHNFYSIINPETDYKETAIIRYLEGMWDNETDLFRTRRREKFLALGKRVTTLAALKEENAAVYADLLIAMENNKADIEASKMHYIVEHYNGLYAFLPKDTAVMDNSFNVIFPEDEVKKDKRFKMHHFKALKKTNAAQITSLNENFWKNRPYCTAPLFNF